VPRQANTWKKLSIILRGDPSVVLVGRSPDSDIASTVAKYADEVRFYIPVSHDDGFKAIEQWVSACGSKSAAGSSLSAVITQRLVRRLCTTCRAPYKPDANMLKKFNLPADKVKQFYQATGKVEVKGKPKTCPACYGLGYRGRVAVFEVIPIDEQARQLIKAGQLEQLRALVRKKKMLYLNESGLTKVVEGVTDIKELTRALGQKKPGKAASQETAASG